MVSIWRIGGYGMISDDWLRRIVWLGMPLISIVIWYYIVKLIIFLIRG